MSVTIGWTEGTLHYDVGQAFSLTYEDDECHRNFSASI